MEYAIGVLVALALGLYWLQRTVERALHTAAIINGKATHSGVGYIIAACATGAAVTLLLLLL